jgi:predicted acetyltransferase
MYQASYLYEENRDRKLIETFRAYWRDECHENFRFSTRFSRDFFLSETLKKKKKEQDFNINLLFFLREFK